MAIQFRCLGCYSVIAISSKKSGEEISCPQCRNRQIVPPRTDPTLAAMPPERALESATPIVVAQAGTDLSANSVHLSDGSTVNAARTNWIVGSAVCAGLLALCAIISAAVWHAASMTLIADSEQPALAQNQPESAFSSLPPAHLFLPAPQPSEKKNERTATAGPLVKTPEGKQISPSPTAQREGTAVPEQIDEAPVSDAKAPVLVHFKAAVKPNSTPWRTVALKEINGADKACAAKENFDFSSVELRKPKTPRIWSEDELNIELRKVPEISLNITAKMRRMLVARARDVSLADSQLLDFGLCVPEEQQSILQGLPIIYSGHAFMAPEQAKQFAEAVLGLRGVLISAAKYKNTNIVEKCYSKQISRKLNDGKIRACVQILQAENELLRETLIALLAKTPGPATSKALAQRAVVDPCARIRQKALAELEKRPHMEFKDELVKFINYPLPAISASASKAIVQLNVDCAVPDLVHLLSQPDVTIPRAAAFDHGVQSAVPQVVRINHLKNCLLCHAQVGDVRRFFSQTTRRLSIPIGAVPQPDRKLPPTLSGAYYSGSDLSVRADVTFLRQDFSVVQPVKDHGKWPGQQRFDFVVRMRPLTVAEAGRLHREYKRHGPSPQRRALLYTLRQLTNGDWPIPRANGHGRAPAQAK